MCDARPLIRIHNMGSSYLDSGNTGKITQYGGVGPPALRLDRRVFSSGYILSPLFNCLRHQTLPGGVGSLGGEEGRCMRDV